MYTALRFFPCAATHSARALAWPTVSSASTSNASRSPEISVAEIGDQDCPFSPGSTPPPGNGASGATCTSQLSDADWSVIRTPWLSLRGGDSVGGLGRCSHQGGPGPARPFGLALRRRAQPPGSARSSCWRLLMPSLVKTLCRWYSTVL